MSVARHRKDDVGPWARQKLDALKAYLDFYTTVLSRQPFQRVYIDAFAGLPESRVRKKTGKVSIGQPELFDGEEEYTSNQEEYITGSPMIALKTKAGFDRYYFFDLDESRIKSLREACAEHSNVEIKFAECNASIQNLAKTLTKRNNVRGVAFLDPFGPHVEWKTIEALAETRTMEAIINFPLDMAINRLITTDPENIRPYWRNLLNKCFGTNEWQALSYAEEKHIGKTIMKKHRDARERLLELYCTRLDEIFEHVSTPRLVRNTKGRPLYYLIWVGHHEMGLKGAEYILKQGEETEENKTGKNYQPKLL